MPACVATGFGRVLNSGPAEDRLAVVRDTVVRRPKQCSKASKTTGMRAGQGAVLIIVT
jgi:hypothetical protein